jgi:hypothetical protein
VSYLNANIPPIYCKIRKEYLYDGASHKGESEDCVIFGIASITSRALLFHIMLPNGAIYYRLPISAFFQKRFSRSEVPDMSVDELQLWNCFSYYPSIINFNFLSGQRGTFFGKDKKEYPGTYLFTVDWGHPDANILDVEHSEIPQEHKCAHILELNNGNYAAQPNNRILWNIPSYTTEVNKPDYKVQTTYWNVENMDWKTDNTNDMFYDIKEEKNLSNCTINDDNHDWGG